MGTAGNDSRVLLVVAAPGRSGTSLLTGLVRRLGFYVPQPELRPNPTNPLGFSESKWAVEFHKRLMQAAAVNYGDTRPEAMKRVGKATISEAARAELDEWLTDQFGHAERVIVKDPRLVWFVGVYRSAAVDFGARFGVLTTLRHPAEVVRSAGSAYGNLEAATVASGWINGTLGVEHSTRTTPRAVVRHDKLMTDWLGTLQAAERSLGIDLVSGATAAELADADELVDASLYRSGGEWTGIPIPAWLRSSAQRTFDTMAALTGDPDPAQLDMATTDIDRTRESWTIDYQAAAAVVHTTITEAVAAERRRARTEAAKAAKAAKATSAKPTLRTRVGALLPPRLAHLVRRWKPRAISVAGRQMRRKSERSRRTHRQGEL